MVTITGCATVGPAGAPQAGSEPSAAEVPAASVDGVPLRLSTTAEPTTLDPNLAEEDHSITPIEQMFLGLTNINNETAEIEPELAESWETLDLTLTWTFNLRDDAVWSDGKPVTAQDVEYSVKRGIKPKTASPYAYVLYIIKNAKAIATRPPCRLTPMILTRWA